MQSKKRVSIADIARQLNISVTTVSFILNGKAKEMRISDALTKKVEDLVQQTNYQPNVLAKSFRTGKTNTIGLLVEDISNPFFAHIARQIEDNAYQRGYKIIYGSTEDNLEKTRELITMFADRHVDGYIITAPEGIDNEVKDLLEMKKPVILFDRYYPGLETNYIGVDNYKGTYDGIVHLIENGYKNIVLVTTTSQQSQMTERQAGYHMALDQYGLESYTHKIAYVDKQSAVVKKQIADFMSAQPQTDAVFFATNYLLACGLEVFKQIGLKVGEDVAVVSFDDHEFFGLFTPSITAVAQPVQDIAHQAINLLLNELQPTGAPSQKKFIQLPAHLVVRESSAAKRRGA
ncbi:transcriptional regulator, LacI family [Filimonas lacunae]|uniref:Transcriptional regulator, LacI family n=1 Tax=Filimonas lacunae TaxID=477680 RepID=A0A173MMF2_9BACT|nr:LacI family DNA-binding transcriptional regulator [Filimonas lacunae]BAV08666.1 transcriptional regulator [Filimonas lacunae]SIS59602.1 transcriptional regulator, LacI family [Filimonas lacunae]